MKTLLALSRQRKLWVCGWIAACTMVASHLGAQSVAPRITSDITNYEQTTLRGSQHPMAQSRFDDGRVPAATRLNGASIYFSRTAEQEADLQELIAAQQDSARRSITNGLRRISSPPASAWRMPISTK